MNPPSPSAVTPASDAKGNHRGLVITALLATALIAVIYGFFRAATREVSVDEGYLMITIRSFLSGHALYDSVFTQYGPIYYCYQWMLHGALGIPLTHDTTRLLCLVHWLATSCIMGWAGYHLTRSAVAAGVVASQTMVHLALLANEPGHPQELIVLLLAASLLLASRQPLSPGLLTGLAVLGTVLIFIKINVGLFYMIALGLTVYCHLGGRFTSTHLTWALAILCAIPPFLLTRRHLNLEWCLVYTLVVAASIVTTFLVAHSVTVKDHLSLRVVLRWILPMALTTAVILGVTLAFGTSLRGALDGMLLIPLKTPNIALLPLPVTWPAVANAVVALGAATMFLRGGTRVDLSRQSLVLKGLYALCGGLLLVGNIKLQIAFLLPWSWLVLVPASPAPTSAPAHNFPRIWLCLLTAWQALQAYPIAGSQVAVATFPLVLGYILCLMDVVHHLVVLPAQEALRKMTSSKLSPVLGVVLYLFLFTNIWCALPETVQLYRSRPSLDLPGAKWIRIDPEAGAIYRGIAKYLTDESTGFITYPGNHSFHFWTGIEPLTQFNGTGWGLLNFEQQAAIIAALQKTDRPRIVVQDFALRIWSQNRPEPIRPLVSYILDDCQPVAQIGPFVIFQPKKSAPLAK